MTPFLIAASIGAPLFAAWVALDHQRVMRQAALRRKGSAHAKDTDGKDFQTAR
jgi:hypothetical protein